MIAAVTILYNPLSNFVGNINSYIDFVDQLYVVDNSDLNNENLVRGVNKPEKITYIFNGTNLGIATALNIGCRKAIEDGFNWVMTMDQDSKVLNFGFSQLELEEKNDNIALYYPSYIINGSKYVYRILEKNKPIVVMSSGNIINLNVFTEVNGFEDKLFIDYVDIDYCLKLKMHNYEIEEIESYMLEHELGNSVTIKNKVFEMIITNHSLIRRYYISRNKFYILKKYKHIYSYYNLEKNTLFKEVIKIIFFEEKKLQKLKVICEGYKDFKLNKFGKKV